MNILTQQNEPNFVKAILKSVIAGFSNDIIVKSVRDLMKMKQASKGILIASPDALRSYAQNLKASLEEIADKVEEMEYQETDNIDNIDIKEDESIYKKDVEANKISGTIIVNFKKDMSNLRKANRIEVTKNDSIKIKNKIFAYLKNEYKTLKADLNDKIFKSNLIFDDVESGNAKINYEINGAF